MNLDATEDWDKLALVRVPFDRFNQVEIYLRFIDLYIYVLCLFSRFTCNVYMYTEDNLFV